MAQTATGASSAPASYLKGDPIHPDSVTDGRLACDPEGLRFNGLGGRELLLSLDSLLGISISGRAVVGAGRKAIHGTMRIAGLRRGEPAEWVFAVDRSEARTLQTQLNRALAAAGRPALPHVEELVGFSGGVAASPAPEALVNPQPMHRVAAELGHWLDGVDRRRPRRKRLWLWIALGALLVALEVALPLILINAG